MADRLVIEDGSVFDNLDERLVEFTGEVDGDEYEFAVQYDVIEALTGEAPDGDAVDSFHHLVDVISDAALSALGRDSDVTPVLVSENDLA